jgi:hypothetical protein
MLLWACRAPPTELPREPSEPQRVLSFVSWAALVDFPDNLPLNSIPARKWASFGSAMSPNHMVGPAWPTTANASTSVRDRSMSRP